MHVLSEEGVVIVWCGRENTYSVPVGLKSDPIHTDTDEGYGYCTISSGIFSALLV